MLLAEVVGMLLAEVVGMLLAEVVGMLLAEVVGMLLAEVVGMLRKLFSTLLASPSMLPMLGGMLPASVSAMPKNSVSATFTPAEYIKPFLDFSPFCSQKATRAASTAGSRETAMCFLSVVIVCYSFGTIP
jgi:hypothetical protein